MGQSIKDTAPYGRYRSTCELREIKNETIKAIAY